MSNHAYEPLPFSRILQDRVIVEQALTQERKTKGGIILPDSIKLLDEYRGFIVGYGERATRNDNSAVVGDPVVYSKYSGTEMEDNDLDLPFSHNGRSFKHMREGDLALLDYSYLKSEYPCLPLENRVIILPDKPLDKTESGIYIPEQAQDKPQRGTVVAVGPGREYDDPMTVEPGDYVIHDKGGGFVWEYQGTLWLVLRESNIMAILSRNVDFKESPFYSAATSDGSAGTV